MDALLIAERLFLLTHDDETGSSSGTVALPNALAGALLLDLAVEALLTAESTTLIPAPGSPSHRLLADALAVLTASNRPRSAKHWVNHLPRALTPIEEQVGRSLSVRGVLRETQHRTLGLFPSTRFLASDQGPEAALRGQLGDVLVRGTMPDVDTGLLVALLHAMGRVSTVVAKPDRRVAKDRARQISEAGAFGTPVSQAVAASVRAVQSAVIAAAVVPAITTAM